MESSYILSLSAHGLPALACGGPVTPIGKPDRLPALRKLASANSRRRHDLHAAENEGWPSLKIALGKGSTMDQNKKCRRIRVLNRVSVRGLYAALLLGVSVSASAQESDKESTAPPSQAEATEAVGASVGEKAGDEVTKKRAELLSEAVEALQQTKLAIEHLDKQDGKKALDALATATGRLDIILARDPGLALAPVDVVTSRTDIIATVADVRKIRDRIEALVKEGRLQDARVLMETFASEIRIHTTNIPLATYPAAIRGAARLIDQGKLAEAKSALNTALSTLVIEEEVLPLPLLRAQAMLSAAEKQLQDGSAKAADEESEKSQIDPTIFIDNASYQVELARALTYGNDSLYEKLARDIEDLKKKVSAKNESRDLFESIDKQIDNLETTVND